MFSILPVDTHRWVTKRTVLTDAAQINSHARTHKFNYFNIDAHFATIVESSCRLGRMHSQQCAYSLVQVQTSTESAFWIENSYKSHSKTVDKNRIAWNFWRKRRGLWSKHHLCWWKSRKSSGLLRIYGSFSEIYLFTLVELCDALIFSRLKQIPLHAE